MYHAAVLCCSEGKCKKPRNFVIRTKITKKKSENIYGSRDILKISIVLQKVKYDLLG